MGHYEHSLTVDVTIKVLKTDQSLVKFKFFEIYVGSEPQVQNIFEIYLKVHLINGFHVAVTEI